MSDSQVPEGTRNEATVAFVLKGYPRLSETFIAQEIHALEARGLDIEIWSLRHPTDKLTHVVNDEIQAAVFYLPEYLYQEPLRVFRAWWKVCRQVGFKAAFKVWCKDLSRDRSSNRVRRFGQACVLAAECNSSVKQLHAHFLHTPASVTRYAAMMTDRPWSCSAHAKDIWTSPRWDLQEKITSLQWLSTCTQYNLEYLNELAAPRQCVFLNYHGLDLERFPMRDEKANTESDKALQLLSVGRAVPKKGYLPLLRTLAQLPDHLRWQFTHIGGGPMLLDMQALVDELGIADKVVFLGAQAQPAVLQAYRSNDVFVLNSTVDESGDRDGLPNVLLEAQSQGLPAISTAISGIPELIIDGVNGRLVDDGDSVALLQAIQEMAGDAVLRKRLGEAGRQRVINHFSLSGNIEDLHDLFKQSLQISSQETTQERNDSRNDSRNIIVKIAFYAPMKSPEHPQPSGDRLIARNVIAALEMVGHEVMLASSIRSWEGQGDSDAQLRLQQAALQDAAELSSRWQQNPEQAPRIWFTYHGYHKSPDWIGPLVSAALSIPYVLMEASHARLKPNNAKWEQGLAQTAKAIEAADLLISINRADMEGVDRVRSADSLHVYIPPFIDTSFADSEYSDSSFADFPSKQTATVSGKRLLAVAMMRGGAKYQSYQILAEALAKLEPSSCCLEIVGDGPAAAQVRSLFDNLCDHNVHFHGALDPKAVAALMLQSDLLVWPGIDEALGMVYLEAQACKLPIIVGQMPGTAELLQHEKTGWLVPHPDSVSMASAIAHACRLESSQLAHMGSAASVYCHNNHSLMAAADQIDRAIRNVQSC